MNTRIATVNISINNQNISRDIVPFLTGFSYTDNLSGEADSAEIQLQDRDGRFRGPWFPTRGDTAVVSIARANWNAGAGVETLPIGTFEIDEIVNSYPPNKAVIKLISIPNNAKIRSVKHSHPWEDVKLSEIAGDIAAEAGMELFYDTEEDPKIKRAEQTEQSALEFLQKQCGDAGLALKVADNKIIIFDEEKYENQKSVLTFRYGASPIESFKGAASIYEIYAACHVKYKHGQKNELIEYTFQAPDKKDGMTLEVNKSVESVEEAEKLAKKSLREKNREEVKVSLSTVGNFLLVAGNVITLEGHGFYDGNYLITRAAHKLGGGYTTDIEARKCLNGY